MRERYLILIVLMLAAGAIFILFTNKSLATNLNDIRRLDDQIKVAQEKLNSARIMEQELSQFAMVIDNALTSEQRFSFDEINDLKTNIGEMAHARQISINRMADASKWTMPNLIESTVTLELEADYVQIGKFISDLESQDNIIKIQTLDISPAHLTQEEEQQAAGKASRYRVLMELSVFKVKKEA